MKLFSSVSEAPLPEAALLREFAERGEYTDCFVTFVDTTVSFPAYVEAFYTTALFKAERVILKWLASRPSTDDEARSLSRNERHAFAAWNEYSRSDNQLVMMDMREQTCSWFMLDASDGETTLYFGSAVMRNREGASGKEMKWTYRAALGFHRLYSRALLQAARSKVLSAMSHSE